MLSVFPDYCLSTSLLLSFNLLTTVFQLPYYCLSTSLLLSFNFLTRRDRTKWCAVRIGHEATETIRCNFDPVQGLILGEGVQVRMCSHDTHTIRAVTQTGVCFKRCCLAGNTACDSTPRGVISGACAYGPCMLACVCVCVCVCVHVCVHRAQTGEGERARKGERARTRARLREKTREESVCAHTHT